MPPRKGFRGWDLIQGLNPPQESYGGQSRWGRQQLRDSGLLFSTKAKKHPGEGQEKNEGNTYSSTLDIGEARIFQGIPDHVRGEEKL